MYPTKEEILKNPVKFKQTTLRVVKNWKRKYSPENRGKETIQELIFRLTKLHNKQVKIVWGLIPGSHHLSTPDKKHSWILLENNSIISALHELAHELFGPSEKTACRWSIWLFKINFPEAYKKLKWTGSTKTGWYLTKKGN